MDAPARSRRRSKSEPPVNNKRSGSPRSQRSAEESMSRDRARLPPSVRGRTQQRLAFSAERNPIREPLGLSDEFPLGPILIARRRQFG
jgi:hypothetical protein